MALLRLATPLADRGFFHVTWRHRNLRKKTTTGQSRTRWVVPRREGSALLGPKVGRRWPRSYPRSMGRPRGHPRGLSVAFEPTLDPSRAGPMATPGFGGGILANPSVQAVTHRRPKLIPTPPGGPLVVTAVWWQR
jgi:hypothetical protein